MSCKLYVCTCNCEACFRMFKEGNFTLPHCKEHDSGCHRGCAVWSD